MTVSLTTLVSFNGTDGTLPASSLISDANGDLLGTTEAGGTPGIYGYGTVFEIINNGTVVAPSYASIPTTLVAFNGANGAVPLGGLIADANGDLFGTTFEDGPGGYGTVFEIVNNGTVAAPSYASIPTTLVAFNGANGANPFGSPIADANGDLFGTTENLGGGYGTVFEIAKTATGYASTPTTLVTFSGPDGEYPSSTLIADAKGDLFGTTERGGGGAEYASGGGTVFEIVNNGTVAAPSYASIPTTLVSFDGANAGTNGFGARGNLITDAHGDLFGTTESGGAGDHGTVFEIVNNGTVAAPSYASIPTTLVAFNGADGGQPDSLIADAKGDLFGTTFEGGAKGLGTVFEIVNNGTVAAPSYASIPTTLVTFDGTNGENPSEEILTADANGDLLGTTLGGGPNSYGTVFEVTGSSFVTLAINGTSVTGTEGSSTGTTTVATFTDANPNATVSDFTANINWGDGSTTTGIIVALNGGGFAVDGAHTYADEGKYAVDVTIKDIGGSTASATSTATVADADVLTGQGTKLRGHANEALTNVVVASFEDSYKGNVASDFTAAINWGDGVSTSGVVTDIAGAITVAGTHTYNKPGHEKVTVTLSDDAPGTATATVTSTINVNHASEKPSKDPDTCDLNGSGKSTNDLQSYASIAGVDLRHHMDLAGTGGVGANATLGHTLFNSNTAGALAASNAIDSARVALLGQYMAASFVSPSNGHGETLISDPPLTAHPLLSLPHG